MLSRINVILAGLLLSVLVLMPLVGCAGPKQEKILAGSEQPQDTELLTPPESESAVPPSEAELPSEPELSAQPEQNPDESAPPETGEEKPLRASDPEAIQEELYDAICAVRQPAPMDISGMTLSEHLEMDVKNLYYSLMSRYPELKYAYDISAAAENGTLTCQISYMPYKTGN